MPRPEATICQCDCAGCAKAHPGEARCAVEVDYGDKLYTCGRPVGHDGRHEAFKRDVSASRVAYSWTAR